MYKGGGVVHCCVRDRDPKPGVGARHPPGAPPRDGGFSFKIPREPRGGVSYNSEYPGPPGRGGGFLKVTGDGISSA